MRGYRYWLTALIVSAGLGYAGAHRHVVNGIVVGCLLLLFAVVVWAYGRLTDARITVMRMGMCPDCRGKLGDCPCGKKGSR